MRIITEEYFTKRTGYPPIQDDLERVNCPKAGTWGHWQCGWNDTHDLPVFSVGRDVVQSSAPIESTGGVP